MTPNERSTRVRIILVTLLAIVPAGCGVLDPEEPAPRMDQIVFISGSSGARDVYRMNVDGSGVVNLTQSPDGYQSVDVTPDGRTVVFSRERDCHIWTMSPNGADKTPLGASCNRLPRLSPDGRLVAYESGNAIHVMGINGTGSREVSASLPPVQPSSCGTTPNWHVWPFGWVTPNRIAFRRGICGAGTTFYSVNADGSGLDELDFNPQTAHLSPDATRIAFDRVDDLGTTPRSVTVMNVDGSNRQTMADGGWLPDRFLYSRSPWSPNGLELYYWRPDGHYVVDVRTAASRRLAEPITDAEFMGWSPQGNRLLFRVNERDQAGATVSSDIHVVTAEGTGTTNLTRSAAFDTEAVWVPR